MLTKTWFEKLEGDDDEATKTAMAIALQSTVARIEDSPEETARRQEMLANLELYLGRKLSGLYQLNGGDYERVFDASRAVFNVAYSVLNTIRSRICSFRARAQFIPAGGNAKARRVARDLTAMSDAWADECNLHAETSFAFRDLLTKDSGCIKIYRDGDKIKASRFPPWEFMVDPAEAIYG